MKCDIFISKSKPLDLFSKILSSPIQAIPAHTIPHVKQVVTIGGGIQMQWVKILVFVNKEVRGMFVFDAVSQK